MTMRRRCLQAALLILGIALMVYGAERGEVRIFFQKAVNICLECIGIG